VYTTNHIMLTMGGDFQYQNARINYKNIDKLIDYVNTAAVCHISMHLQLVLDRQLATVFSVAGICNTYVLCSICLVHLFTSLPVDVQSIVISIFVCLFVCLSDHISPKITRPNFAKCSVHVTSGRGLIRRWLCNTSAFVDDVTFSVIEQMGRIRDCVCFVMFTRW